MTAQIRVGVSSGVCPKSSCTLERLVLAHDRRRSRVADMAETAPSVPVSTARTITLSDGTCICVEPDNPALVCDALAVLLRAVKRVEAEGSGPDTYSVQDFARMQTLVDLVVCLGVLPLCDEGVGVPLSLRSRKYDALVARMPPMPHRTPSERVDTLLNRVGTLCAVAANGVTRRLVVPRFCGDLVAALLQSIHLAEGLADGPALVARGRENLDALTSRVLPVHLIPALSLLASAHPKAPSWLKMECCRQLSKCLMRPGGVAAALDGLLAGSSDESCGAVAVEQAVRLVSAVPAQVSGAESYLARVGPQLRSLLWAPPRSSPRVLPVAVAVCARLLRDRPRLAFRYVLRDLLGPLLAFERIRAGSGLPTGATSGEHEGGRSDLAAGEVGTAAAALSARPPLFDEGQVVLCVEVVHRLLCSSGASSPVIVNAVAPDVLLHFPLSQCCKDCLPRESGDVSEVVDTCGRSFSACLAACRTWVS